MERSSNVFKFQGSNMIVSAKGPNIERNMNMSTNFRSNLMSSTMNLPQNFEKQSSAMSVVSQRSIYYGRETSPTASVRSDMQPRNFYQSFYQRGFSQRSVYSGRGGSPVSMRSIDSSASLATDIVQAINSGNFNRQEWKMIQDAFARSHRRKYGNGNKVGNRRRMKYSRKDYSMRHRFGDDSGEQGSNSSISSDDCASTRTGYSRRYDRNYKENIPRSTTSTDHRSEDIFQSDNRDTFRGYSVIDSQNPYRRHNNFQGDMDHPANMLPFQTNSKFGNMYLSQRNGPPHNQNTLYSQNKSVIGSTNTFYNQKYLTAPSNMLSTQKHTVNSSVCSTKSMQNMTMMSQRDRFKGGFQFPSQKFNKSSTLYEEQQVLGRQFPTNQHTTKNHLYTEHIEENSDGNDDIFLDTDTSKPLPKKSAPRPKRKAESLGDLPVSAKKKPKTSNLDKSKKLTQNTKDKMKEFEFVKPQFPIRKSAPAKPKEKLISKSLGAPDIVFSAPEKDKPCPEKAEPENNEPDIEPEPEPLENTQLTNSDVSMRPSFLKRKLFTQTLDVTERKNNSSDSLNTDSPQSNIYSALSREKHKTRKLVISQSLLSRDLNQDDNNLLDLIHKIVPPNQVNSTIISNITKSFNSRVSENKPDGDDKFDITSIISTCNNDSVSETYTDDEIFKVNNDEKKKKPQEKPPTKQINTEVKSRTIPIQENKATNSCTKKVKIILNKVALPIPPKVQTPVKTCPAKAVVTSHHIEGFWDTDVESDCERATPRPQEPLYLRDNHPEVRPTNLSMKFTKISKTHELSPVVKKQEPMLVKVLKKKSTRKTPNKSETKTVKKSNDNTKTIKKTNDDKKTSKKLSDDTQKNNFHEDTQSLKSERPKRGTPTITFKTRRQINLSATLDTVNKTSRNKKSPSPNKTVSNNDKTAQTKKKPIKENKTVEEKNSKTNPPQKQSRKQNDSQPKIKNKVETPRSESRTKTRKLPDSVEQIETSVCKMLRSRVVDLSSSFNSDKFELTTSRTRKSRTPSKRISFNKSKNLLVNNKTRNRATKA